MKEKKLKDSKSQGKSEDKTKAIERKIIGKSFFDDIASGKKTFDVRINDFEIKEGDSINFKEWDAESKDYTGREVKKKASYVLKSKDYEGEFWEKEDAEEKGYVVMGFENKEQSHLEGWKRAKADLSNLQGRVEKEKQDFVKYAKLDMIMQLLEVKDNFDQAMSTVPEEIQNNSWIQGVKYISNQLEKTLSDNNVEEITVKIGDTFNPEIHEAIEVASHKSQVTNVEKERESKEGDHKITKIFKKGYKMNDKVIRPAMVSLNGKHDLVVASPAICR